LGKGGSQTVTQQLDPATASYVQQMRRAALGVAGVGAPPGGSGSPTQGGWAGLASGLQSPGNLSPIPSGGAYAPYQQLGLAGVGAMTGGPNPFMNTQVNALNPTFDYLRQNALSLAGDQATQQGAFGGDRSALFSGQAIGDVNRQQALFNYQAFNDAQQRAWQAANLGFGAVGAPLDALRAGMGPWGQTTKTTQETDPFSQFLGLGLTAASFAYPPLAPVAAAGNQFARGGSGGLLYK